MVVNGASRRCVWFWTKHLANDLNNDRAELREIRGLAATNLRDALLEMQEDARHTRCQNFFYQANFNPCANERLTEEQWERAFEIFEKHRGIPPGQPRVVYEHEKEGRVHRHVIWSRIDLENMRAWKDGLDAKVCHAASREISEELGLQRTISPFDKDREGPRPARAPESYEMFRGQRSGLDPRDIKAEVTAIFRESQNGADFAAGLRQHGYLLVQGDRRDYCILDSAGEPHSLARRLDGVNAKQLRSFMQDLQRDALPTIAQAKRQFEDRKLPEREADLASVRDEIAWEEALAKAAIEKEKVEGRFKEPTPGQIRQEGRREKVWPVNAPGNERTTTSPGYHFEDAARQVANPERIPVMPENLKGYAALIWTAYNIRTWVQEHKAEVPRETRPTGPGPEEVERPEAGIRMYRGIGRNVWAAEHGEALFFSTDPSRAAAFGELHYVDVTTAEMAKFERPHSQRILEQEPIAKDDWRTADPAIIARLKPLESERMHEFEDALEDERPVRGSAIGKKDGKEIEVRQRDPDLFKQALEEKGVALAAVTKEEADRSHRGAEFARAVHGFAPRYKEGEIVAVTEQGYVYKLGRRTTGEDPVKVQQFLKPLDRSQLQGIDATKEMLKARAEQNIHEVQAFRDLLRDTKNAERMKKATTPKGKSRLRFRIPSIPPAVGKTTSIGVAAMEGVFGSAAKLADGVVGLFDPILTPVQKAEAKVSHAERESDAKQGIDFSKYTAQRAIEQLRERESIEKGRERER